MLELKRLQMWDAVRVLAVRLQGKFEIFITVGSERVKILSIPVPSFTPISHCVEDAIPAAGGDDNLITLPIFLYQCQRKLLIQFPLAHPISIVVMVSWGLARECVGYDFLKRLHQLRYRIESVTMLEEVFLI